MPLMKMFLILMVAPLLVFAHGGEHDAIIIKMTENGFEPNEISILTGDTILFENDDVEDRWPASNVHPTHAVYSELDPKKPISPTKSWSFTFDKAGEWAIHDHLFPHMQGSIMVSAEGTDTVEAEKPGFFSRLWQTIKNFFRRLFGINNAMPVDDISQTDAENEEADGDATDLPKSSKISVIDTKFVAPISYDANEIYNNFNLECDSSDHGCISNVLKDLTRTYGPVAGVEMLQILMDDGRVSGSINDHQLAHEIGRETSRAYGVNSEAFLLCPMSAFNGGCQHGFFEYVLGKTDTSTEAADLICNSLGEEYSNKFKFYCYHGVGHGVMMAQAYDLDASLDICDSFSSVFAQDGCWQGVFMENVNAGSGRYARDGVFSDIDPLAPCNKVDERHRHECYINHAGYLMSFYHNDVSNATVACLSARDEWKDSCLQSIGLMVTNPVWQANLLSNAGQYSNEQGAWELCKQFPDGWRRECVIGGVDNIVNFDEFEVTRAMRFCDLVDAEDRELCYTLIGSNLRNQATDLVIVREKCNQFFTDMKNACLRGAGL
jgi:plastocyanin